MTDNLLQQSQPFLSLRVEELPLDEDEQKIPMSTSPSRESSSPSTVYPEENPSSGSNSPSNHVASEQDDDALSDSDLEFEEENPNSGSNSPSPTLKETVDNRIDLSFRKEPDSPSRRRSVSHSPRSNENDTRPILPPSSRSDDWIDLGQRQFRFDSSGNRTPRQDVSILLEEHRLPECQEENPPAAATSTTEPKYKVTARKICRLVCSPFTLGCLGVAMLGGALANSILWGSEIDDLTEECAVYLNSTLPRIFDCDFFEENKKNFKITYPVIALAAMTASGCIFQELVKKFQKFRSSFIPSGRTEARPEIAKPRIESESPFSKKYRFTPLQNSIADSQNIASAENPPSQKRSIKKIGLAFAGLLEWFFGAWLYRGLWLNQHDARSWNTYYKLHETAIHLISFELGRNIRNRLTTGRRCINKSQKNKKEIPQILDRLSKILIQVQEHLEASKDSGIFRKFIQKQVALENFTPSNSLEKLNKLSEVFDLAYEDLQALYREDRDKLKSLELARGYLQKLLRIYQHGDAPLSTLYFNLILVAISTVVSIAFLDSDLEPLTKELFIALGTRPFGQIFINWLQKKGFIKMNELLKRSHSLLTFVPFYFYARHFSSSQTRAGTMASIGWLSGVKEAFHEKLDYTPKNRTYFNSKNMLEAAWIIFSISSGILLLKTGEPKCYDSNPYNCVVALGVEEQWINLDGKGCGITFITTGVSHLARKVFRSLGTYFSFFNKLVDWTDRWSFEFRLLAPYFGFNAAKHLEEFDAYVSHNPLAFVIPLGAATGILTDQAFNAQNPEEGEAAEYSNALSETMDGVFNA